MQSGGVKEKGREDKDSKTSQRSEGRESHQKENVQSGGGAAVEEGGDTYRGKQLPPGMKVKKRVSDEERRSPKGNSVEKKPEEENTEQRKSDKAAPASTVCAVEETNQTSQDPHKHSAQKPTSPEARQVKEADPAVRKSGSESAPSSSSTMAYRDSDNTKSPACDKPTQSESNQTKKENKDDDDDDDDVVLVSVKPPAQKTPPATTVQKQLTSFQGFQPASKVKGQQQDPKGLHSLLTAQLQQKKVIIF